MTNAKLLQEVGMSCSTDACGYKLISTIVTGTWFRVARFRPSFAAARQGPPTNLPACSRVSTIWARLESSKVNDDSKVLERCRSGIMGESTWQRNAHRGLADARCAQQWQQD